MNPQRYTGTYYSATQQGRGRTLAFTPVVRQPEAHIRAQLPNSVRGNVLLDWRIDRFNVGVNVVAYSRRDNVINAERPGIIVEFYAEAPDYKIPPEKLALMCMVF